MQKFRTSSCRIHTRPHHDARIAASRDDCCAILRRTLHPTHRLFLEVSSVRNRRDPHMWVAEFTSQVEWYPVPRCDPKMKLVFL